MPRVNALSWRYVSGQYVATYTASLGISPSDPLIVNLVGSYGRDYISARSIEVDAGLTTAPFTLYIDGVARVIKTASYSTWNFSPISNEVRLTGGAGGDVATLNFYSSQQTEWR